MVIRRALVSDTDQICAVHTASIRRFRSAACSAAQIDEWTDVLAPERDIDAITMLEFVVVAVEGQLEGSCMLHLEGGALHAIYLAAAFAGKGHVAFSWPGVKQLPEGMDGRNGS